MATPNAMRVSGEECLKSKGYGLPSIAKVRLEHCPRPTDFISDCVAVVNIGPAPRNGFIGSA